MNLLKWGLPIRLYGNSNAWKYIYQCIIHDAKHNNNSVISTLNSYKIITTWRCNGYHVWKAFLVMECVVPTTVGTIQSPVRLSNSLAERMLVLTSSHSVDSALDKWLVRRIQSLYDANFIARTYHALHWVVTIWNNATENIIHILLLCQSSQVLVSKIDPIVRLQQNFDNRLSYIRIALFTGYLFYSSSATSPE